MTAARVTVLRAEFYEMVEGVLVKIIQNNTEMFKNSYLYIYKHQE